MKYINCLTTTRTNAKRMLSDCGSRDFNYEQTAKLLLRHHNITLSTRTFGAYNALLNLQFEEPQCNISG